MKFILYKTKSLFLSVVMLFQFTLPAQTQVTFTGDPVICDTTNTWITAHIDNASNYIWSSNENSATIPIFQAGTYTVTATDINGNTSSASIQIFDSKMVSNIQFDLCQNSTTSISPAFTDGYWTANNPNVATITSDGKMTAIDAGKATFSFHFDHSTCVAETKEFEVHELPTVSSSKQGYCLEDVIQLSPSQGGAWSSLENQLATVKNNGEGTPLSPGNPKFIFTSSETGCSRVLENVVIYPRPVIEIAGKDTICPGFTSSLKSSSGGTWTTLNSAIASINNAGLITGLTPGRATFQHIQSSTGCISLPSPSIFVIPRPKITTDLPGIICMGGDEIVLPAPFEGNWKSSHPTIAKINQEGIIEILKAGNVSFEIYAYDISCSSEPISFTFQNIKPGISNHTIKQNSFIDLKTDAPGTWTSLDADILRISENQKAVSLHSGKTKLEFVADAGCYAYFGVEVKSGKIGSNTNINLGGFTNNSGDGSQFISEESETRKTEKQSNESFSDINIYPNPSSDVIYFESTLDWDQIQIHNLHGQLIWQSNGLINEINTSTWQPGMYQVSFVQGGHRVIKKLIKI